MHFRPDGRLELQSEGGAFIRSASGRHAEHAGELMGNLETTSRGVFDRIR